MRFVDEQDDRRGGRTHFLDQALEAVFELSLDPRPRLQQGEVERAQAHVLEHRWDVTLHDPHGEALDHRGLADPRLAHQNRIVLAPSGQDVDHLTDLEVPAEHGVEGALARPLGQVDGVLIEIRSLAPDRARRPFARRRETGSLSLLDRVLHDARKVLTQAFRRDLCELLAHLLDEATELVVGYESEDRVARTDQARPVVHRADEPGVSEHPGEGRAERRGPRVAGLEPVEAARQVVREPGAVHLEVFEDVRRVGVAGVEQLQEEVLDLDVVVRARETQPRGALEGAARLIVQLADQTPEIHVHTCARLIASTASRPRPVRTPASEATSPNRVTTTRRRSPRPCRTAPRLARGRAGPRSRTDRG